MARTRSPEIPHRQADYGEDANPNFDPFAAAGPSSIQGGEGGGLTPFVVNPPRDTSYESVLQARERELKQNPWTGLYAQNAFGGGNLQMSGFNTANQDQARTEQARVIQALQAQAAGNMNTLGQQQLTQGFQRAGQQQQSLGSSIRGTGGGAGLRAGAMGAADVQRGLAGEQQMLKLQEQQAAQAMLAQLMAQQHAQDVGLAGSMAQGALAGQGLNQDMERFYGSGLTEQMLGGYQRAFDLERARAGYDLEARDTEARNMARLAQAGATGAAALSRMGSNGNSGQQPTGYRQVDGQNSIVPLDDK